MRRPLTSLRALLLAALSAAFVAVASPVFSQGTAWAQSPGPSAFQSMDVTLLDAPDIQEPLLLISGELPASTRLPAEVAIPIPAKSRVQWAGEILGGPVAQDPQAQPRIESKGAYDLAVFTLTKARTGQVEVPVPDAARVTGSTRTATVSWVSAAAVPSVTVAVRISSTAKVTKPPAGATRTAGADGTVQYARTFSSVKPGQKLSMQLGYTPGAAPPSGQTPQQPPGALTGSAPSTAAPTWIPFAIAAAVAASAYWFLSRRAKRLAGLELEPEPEPAPVKRPPAKRAPTRQGATSAGKGTGKGQSQGKGTSQGKGRPKGNGQSAGRPRTPKAPKAPAPSRAKAPAQQPEPEPEPAPEPEAGLLGDIFDD